MKCVDCQEELIEIPTTQGPDLDVCPSHHGLWVDAGEVNLLVEDYASLKRAAGKCGNVAVLTQTLCPHCRIPMEHQTILEAMVYSCGTCHGWWLPSGSLSSLNLTFRGSIVPIHVDELDLYARAQARALASSPPSPRESTRRNTHPSTESLWVIAVIFVLALSIGAYILVVGIEKTTRSSQWIRPPDQIFLFLMLGTISGLGLCVYGCLVQNRKRLIESIPTSAIRSLALGLVEISGRAQPSGGLFSSPFSELPCVFYTYLVEEQVGTGKSKRWNTVAKGTSELPFFVNDGTGRVLIVPHGAELIFQDERTYQQNWINKLPPSTVAGLSRLGISNRSWLGNRPLRCRETSIQPEELIYVLGTAREQDDAKHLLENASRLYIGSSPDHHFIISDRSEAELVSRMQWQVWGAFLGGVILVTTCLTLVFRYYLRMSA